MAGQKIVIPPKESFPNEPHLTPQWHGFLEHMQEREIEKRWVPDRRFPADKNFQQFQANHPNEAKLWVDTQVTAYKHEREQGVTSWLESRTLAQKESVGRNPLAPTFADHAAETVFNNLQYIGMYYAVAPDRNLPATDAVVAEVRRRATDPGGLVRDVLSTAQRQVNAFLGPVERELNELATALDKWSNALATDSSPNGDALTQLATACRDRLDVVHKEVLAFKPAVGIKDPTYITENVRRYVETLAGVIAEQFESRGAISSFHGMANRLSERFHGQDISPTVRAEIQNRSGDYREVWSKGRDALINSIADRAEKNAVKSAFGTANLGPALDDWAKEFAKLSSGNYSKKTMQKAVLQLTFAADAYRKVVEEKVSDPNIQQRFRELLDGIQLSIAKEVSFCVDQKP
jgi:hypothetical protein